LKLFKFGEVHVLYQEVSCFSPVNHEQSVTGLTFMTTYQGKRSIHAGCGTVSCNAVGLRNSGSCS
jgi:hypothetical protein